ncbi:glycosyltransferase [Chryseobacterium sp. NEB161]|nr:glycosyltransferase [Chryseobacterium sp. NEB161]
MKNQLISIIVPCYNQEQYLDDCLQSVIEQTYEHWECIIINDGSTDNTSDVAKAWLDKDQRFIYIENKNKGVAVSRNIGIQKAKGDWIQFLDGDDIILASKLEESMAYSKEYNFIYTDFKVLIDNKILPPFCDLSKRKLNVNNLILYWDNGLNIPIHTPVLKKDLLVNISFNDNFKLHEDWLFWLQLFKTERVSPFFINKPLVLYRSHHQSSSQNQDLFFSSQKDVYYYAYDRLLTIEERELLFSKFLMNYFIMVEKKNKLDKFYFQIINSKYYRLKKFFFKLIK